MQAADQTARRADRAAQLGRLRPTDCQLVGASGRGLLGAVVRAVPNGGAGASKSRRKTGGAGAGGGGENPRAVGPPPAGRDPGDSHAFCLPPREKKSARKRRTPPPRG